MGDITKRWTNIIQKAKGDIFTYYHKRQFRWFLGIRYQNINHKETVYIDGDVPSPGFKQIKKVNNA